MTICEIKWDILSLDEWQQRFNQAPKSNILQTYEYAKIICAINNQKSRWGVIYIDDKEAGLIQTIEAGLIKNLIHGVIIDRAPLWFEGYGNQDHIEALVKNLSKQFKDRFGRRRRFIPEFKNSPEIFKIMQENGFKKSNKVKNYQTIWVDLRKTEEELRSSLKGKWRNSLKKSESFDMEIIWDTEGKLLKFLMKNYTIDKIQKKYNNISVYTLNELAKYLIPKKQLHICKITKDGKDMASCLIFTHGTSATYQIGWLSETARKSAANNFALWQSMLYLKSNGIKYFDLGGINDSEASGIKKFKEGMGGDIIELCGLYH